MIIFALNEGCILITFILNTLTYCTFVHLFRHNLIIYTQQDNNFTKFSCMRILIALHTHLIISPIVYLPSELAQPWHSRAVTFSLLSSMIKVTSYAFPLTLCSGHTCALTMHIDRSLLSCTKPMAASPYCSLEALKWY